MLTLWAKYICVFLALEELLRFILASESLITPTLLWLQRTFLLLPLLSYKSGRLYHVGI